jgi:hypothetical protein
LFAGVANGAFSDCIVGGPTVYQKSHLRVDIGLAIGKATANAWATCSSNNEPPAAQYLLKMKIKGLSVLVLSCIQARP